MANASVTAAQLGNTALATQLNNLATAITNLVQSPGNPVFLSQYEAERERFKQSTGIAGLYSIGRNGGFAMTWWSKFPSLQKLCGTNAAVDLCRRSEEAVVDIGPDETATQAKAHPCSGQHRLLPGGQ